MTRSDFLRRLAALGAAPLAGLPLLAAACRTPETVAPATDSTGRTMGTPAGDLSARVPPPDPQIAPLAKTDAEWQAILDRDAYDVLRRHATERSGSSPLNEEHRDGTFVCAGCFLPLFESAAKFESGTGWPSFTAPIAGNLGTTRDTSLPFEVRTEYHCARCGGHQGHVFNDGPRPTGLRYCNNGVALRFVTRGTALPALRT